MQFPSGEVPDEPRINSAKCQLSILSQPSCNIDTWRRLSNRANDRVVICVGETLSYAMEKFTNESIYWTTDPRSELPSELGMFEEIIILEPYTASFIQVPETIRSRVVQRHFSIEHKKIMTKNMGWEDLEI